MVCAYSPDLTKTAYRYIPASRFDKTSLYPEVVQALSGLHERRLLLDGEVVYFHPELGRPVFQKVLQRERSRAISTNAPLFTYVLFDILVDGDQDLRKAALS